MSDIRCVIDGRNQPRPGATICGHCLARLDDNLARIAELTRWASAWLMPRTGHGEGGRSVPGSRPPLLAGCSSTTPRPSSTPTPAAVADLIAAHPGCAGKVEQLTDGGVSCAVEGRLYLLYVLPDAATAADAAASLRTLHPAGQVDLAGTRVWVTE